MLTLGYTKVNKESEPVFENWILNSTSTIMNYRKFIFYCILFSAIVTMIVALLMPNWYKSTASIIPVEESNLLNELGSVSSPLKSFSNNRRKASVGIISKPLGSKETDLCLSILKSNKVLLAVVHKFDLVNVYRMKDYPFESPIKELLENVEFKVLWEGNLNITVFDKDPQRAADMANYFAEILNKTYTELVVQSVKSNMQFVKEHYRSNLINLSIAEDSLNSYKKRYGIIALPEQTKVYIETITELKGMLTVKEVYADVLRKTLSIDHPDVKAIEFEIDELQKKLSEITSRTHLSEGDMNVFAPFSNTPALIPEYFRKDSAVAVQYKLLQYLTSLYEQAKAEERRNIPLVIVLDRALPAEQKSMPQRILIILGGMFVGGFGAFSFSLLYENWIREKKKNTIFYKSISSLSDVIRNDIDSLRSLLYWK